MFISFKNKQDQTVKISLENIKEIINLENSYVRFFYQDNTEINIAYNSKSFGFHSHHEATIEEINNIIHEVTIIP